MLLVLTTVVFICSSSFPQKCLLNGQDNFKCDLVSIITPVYNMERYLHRYLNSILSQTYEAIELILINDGSTDNSEQIIKSYFPILESKVVSLKYISKKNEGLGAAINTGLQVFTGSYLIWPDSDDFLDDKSIEMMVTFLKENKKYDLVRVNVNRWVDKKGKLIHSGTLAELSEKNDRARFKEDLFDTLVFETSGFWLCPGSYMIKTDAFMKANPLKTIYPCRRGQNWQMLLPVVYHAKCGYIDKALHNYVIREGSMSRSDISIQNKLDRCDEHEDILMNTIKSIKGLNVKKYAELIKRKYRRRRAEIIKKKKVGSSHRRKRAQIMKRKK